MSSSPENISRVYSGEPALVGGVAVRAALSPGQFEAAYYVAEDMSTEDIVQETGRPYGTVRDYIHQAYQRLGVSSKTALAPYFPIDPDSPLLDGKRLMDLESAPRQLEVLEALSVGQDYKTIAANCRLSDSTVRSHVSRVVHKWPDVKGG